MTEFLRALHFVTLVAGVMLVAWTVVMIMIAVGQAKAAYRLGQHDARIYVPLWPLGAGALLLVVAACT